MNDTTVKAIRKLKDGSGEFIWQASLAAGQPEKGASIAASFSSFRCSMIELRFSKNYYFCTLTIVCPTTKLPLT